MSARKLSLPFNYQNYNSQSGNALFLILIAVALFAALSYAITHSDRGGTTISKEQALINAGLEQDCTARVEQAVLRLKTLGGCTDTTISYELADGTNHNDNAPLDKSCNVFDPAGAGESPCGSYLVADEGGGEGNATFITNNTDLYWNGGGASTGAGYLIEDPSLFITIATAALAAYHAQYGSYPADLSTGTSGGGCRAVGNLNNIWDSGDGGNRPCLDNLFKNGGLSMNGMEHDMWAITGSRRYCHAPVGQGYDHCYSYDSGTGTFTDHGGAPD